MRIPCRCVTTGNKDSTRVEFFFSFELKIVHDIFILLFFIVCYLFILFLINYFCNNHLVTFHQYSMINYNLNIIFNVLQISSM